MTQTPTYGGLDAGKLLAAVLVVAIHTSPLASYSDAANFFLTRVLGRLAVPFFFLVTGHFVLGPVLADPKGSLRPLGSYSKRLLLLYCGATLLYFPLGWYAGHYQNLTLSGVLRLAVFDGTFYHLWYFPACVTGLFLVALLAKKCSPKALGAVTGLLYLLALLGDSYYGVAARIPPLAGVYEVLFQGFTYTRNGLFMAPLFLLLGARLGQEAPPPSRKGDLLGLGLSFAAMTGEAFLLRRFALQRHDSMYFFLPLCLVFLYRLALRWQVHPPAQVRRLSTGIYLLHPALLVVLRGLARAVGLTWLLVDNSLVCYLALLLLTAGAALVPAAVLPRKISTKNPPCRR